MLKRFYIIIIAFICSVSNVIAQGERVGSDFFQAIGKMYVVVTVIALVFIGLIIYLIILDNKISKLEKRIRK